MANPEKLINAYIDLFNARRAVDGEPPISPKELPLYKKVLAVAPLNVLDTAGWKAEQWAKVR